MTTPGQRSRVGSGATVVFDLDETLTRIDTFLPFLRGYLRHHPRRWWSVACLPLRLMNVRRWGDRDWVKDTVVRSVLGGETWPRVTEWAHEYARWVHAMGMRPVLLDWLRAHQRAGDRVVLATASFDVYVAPLASALGIDEVIASRIRWSDDNRLLGMAGRNCRNDEKLRRVRELLGESGTGVIAYSDSHADLPLLAWAERGIAVSPTAKLAGEVGRLGLDVIAD